MLAQDLTSKTLTSKTLFESPDPVILWEKLPDDFILPDDPVDNISQNSIAAGLSSSMRLAGLLTGGAFVCTDYAITANVDGKTVVKAPDWAYIANVTSTLKEINRSYTPHLDGEVPTLVIEMLSKTDGGEYSKQPEGPMGKWYFYEQVLKVPYYGIFEPESGDFEVYRLNDAGVYQRLLIEESGRYWIPRLDLEIGAWKGNFDGRYGYWLRLWYANGVMLPWDIEVQEVLEETEQRLDLTQQRLDSTQQELELTKQRLSEAQERADRLLKTMQDRDRLIAQLRALGIEPDIN